MKLLKFLAHVICDVAVAAAVLGIPVLLTGHDRTDAVSGATALIDAPSGAFVVLLNTDTVQESAFYEAFFTGQEVCYCFEDITCAVTANDPAALQMAQSFQSRLSEHQMTIRQEEQTLLLSKADHGRFQVVILSKELAETAHADSAVQGDVIALNIGQEDTP
ncbi:MAG: hypothetical protein K5695_09330 [Oscillospiraceae bacterium]|nr:hypothetical protein [Oscillospiraceae bacterium]